MGTDRFGNAFAPGLPYARGQVIASTEDDYRKIQHAWQVMAARVTRLGPDSIFNLTGLERSLPLAPDELPFADDEVGPALHFSRFHALALEHLGGSPDAHDVALLNRMTAATLATHLALVRAGDVVVGVAPGYTHPSIVRAAGHVGARFVEAGGAKGLAEVLERERRVSLVALTRLSVSYELLPLDVIHAVIHVAHGHGALVYVDDAGGARVGPAVFDQPRTLELGADLGATGLDKYGTVGPRLGLLGGDKALVSKIRARALEFGLEARPMLLGAAVRSLAGYRPERVRALVESTRRVAEALTTLLGDRVRQTPVTAQLHSDDILAMAMERARLTTPPIVPYEAKAALAMLLLEEHGILTVHFAGLPPGTPSLLFKFVPPDTLRRFGGPQVLAKAVDGCLDRLAELLGDADRVRALLFGAG